MSIYNLLKEDHDRVAELFEQLEERTQQAVKTREQTFATLKSELEAHSEAEQNVFYSALKEYDETRERVLESIQEHDQVNRRLTELGGMIKDTEEWMVELNALKEMIERHVQEEEDELFDLARQVLSSHQADALGSRFEQEKEKLL